jgi:cob(I)alamin adenosyltransferase
MSNSEDTAASHKQEMQQQQAEVRRRIARAKTRRGIVIYLYGKGKGKSSSAFGTVARSLGHKKRAGIVQFIKGKWKTGEHALFREFANVDYQVMGTGFTWDTQDREQDIRAAEQAWGECARMLQDESYDILLFDEITYMFKYEYLPVAEVVEAIKARPVMQNVILTGRDPIPELLEIADTISEVKDIKHAFEQGIKAQKGIDF